MAQLLGALAIVALAVYFLFFRTPDSTGNPKPPSAYQTEVQKAQQVEQQLQQSVEIRQQAVDTSTAGD